MKHEPISLTLNEITARIFNDTDEEWWRVMWLDPPIPESAPAEQWADWEEAYLAAHEKDVYRVVWPEHVIVPRFNSDANYLPCED